MDTPSDPAGKLLVLSLHEKHAIEHPTRGIKATTAYQLQERTNPNEASKILKENGDTDAHYYFASKVQYSYIRVSQGSEFRHPHIKAMHYTPYVKQRTGARTHTSAESGTYNYDEEQMHHGLMEFETREKIEANSRCHRCQRRKTSRQNPIKRRHCSVPEQRKTPRRYAKGR